MNEPSGNSALRYVKRLWGSHAVTVPTVVKSPRVNLTSPPSCGSISVCPMNQASVPGPVAMASHTCSGDALNSSSLASWYECVMSTRSFFSGFDLGHIGRLGRNAGVDGDNQSMAASALGALVVVFRDH